MAELNREKVIVRTGVIGIVANALWMPSTT